MPFAIFNHNWIFKLESVVNFTQTYYFVILNSSYKYNYMSYKNNALPGGKWETRRSVTR